MKKLVILGTIFVFFVFVLNNMVYAEDSNSLLMDRITQNIINVCQAPTTSGKYWKVNVKGSGDAKIKLKIADVGTSGEATFTKKEWEGVQQVLQEQQAKENADYRDCAKKITPLFLEKFVPESKKNITQLDKDNCLNNLLKCSEPLAVYVPKQSLANITYPAPNSLTVQFQNNNNGSGVAFRLQPILNIQEYNYLELSGLSTKPFHFYAEYKQCTTNGEVVIVQRSKQQVFSPSNMTSTTTTIPINNSIKEPICEIVLNFNRIGESSQFTIETLKLTE